MGAKTARTIHLLSEKLNLNITLVASVSPSTFLPVTDLSLPNVFDLKPLSHYIEGVVSFLQSWNWTRIGLITESSARVELSALLRALSS